MEKLSLLRNKKLNMTRPAMSATGHSSEDRACTADDSCFRAFLQKAGLKSGDATATSMNSRRKCRVSLHTLAAPILGVLALSLLSVAPLTQAAESDELGDHLPFLADDNLIDNDDQIDEPDELKEALEEPGELSLEELSRELTNPNSPLSSLTFKHVYTSFDGDLPDADKQSSHVTLFQPIFPFPLTDDGTTNLFFRPVLPYAWQQPVFKADKGKFEDESGLLDPGFDVAIGRTGDDGFIVVAGLQGTTPWGDNDLSADQWRLGPEFLAAKIGKKYFWAVFPAHQWDVSGGDDKYSTTQLELFAGVFLPNAWTLYTDSKWFYDWKDNQATIPINATLRKVVKFGNMPTKLEVSVDYFVEANDDFGQDWALTLNVSPVVPNFIYDAFN